LNVVSESVRLAVVCIWSRACASCSFSKVELTETEWTESRRCCECVGEMSEPEKEEASVGFEAEVWLAMVLLSGSIWRLYPEALAEWWRCFSDAASVTLLQHPPAA
jgi:hypothetical protein